MTRMTSFSNDIDGPLRLKSYVIVSAPHSSPPSLAPNLSKLKPNRRKNGIESVTAICFKVVSPASANTYRKCRSSAVPNPQFPPHSSFSTHSTVPESSLSNVVPRKSTSIHRRVARYFFCISTTKYDNAATTVFVSVSTTTNFSADMRRRTLYVIIMYLVSILYSCLPSPSFLNQARYRIVALPVRHQVVQAPRCSVQFHDYATRQPPRRQRTRLMQHSKHATNR